MDIVDAYEALEAKCERLETIIGTMLQSQHKLERQLVAARAMLAALKACHDALLMLNRQHSRSFTMCEAAITAAEAAGIREE